MTKDNAVGKVVYWKYSDGWHYVPAFLRKDKDVPWEYSPENVGWFCWAYPSNDEEFLAFVDTLPSAEATHRFNGGDCMYTTWIRNKNDADVFARRFGQHV